MSIALVQQISDFTYPAGAQPALTLSGVTKGNLLIATLSYATATDNTTYLFDGVNLWVPLSATPFSTGSSFVQSWYAIARRTGNLTINFFSANAPAGGNGSVRANLATAGVQLMEWSGALNGPVDHVATGTGSGTTATATVATSSTNELVIGILVPTATSSSTPNVGFSSTNGAGANSAIFALEASASSYTPSFNQSVSGTWGVIAASFRSAADSVLHTIAGGLGVAGAGAQVLFFSATTGFLQSATADGSGNYTSPSLADDSYIVQPQLLGQVFSPQSSVVALSGSNSTGNNFTASTVNTKLILTQTASDTFFRVDENPLSQGGNWTRDGNPVPPFDPDMAIVSDEAVIGNTAILSNFTGPWAAGGISIYTGYNFSRNHYAQVQVDALNSATPISAIANLALRRSNAAKPALAQMNIFNNGDGTCAIICSNEQTDVTGRPVGSGNVVPLNPQPWGVSVNPAYAQQGFVNLMSVPFSLGDTFAFACIGSNFYALHNGAVIGNYVDTTTYGTAPWFPLLMAFGRSQPDVKFSNFTAGSVSNSTGAIAQAQSGGTLISLSASPAFTFPSNVTVGNVLTVMTEIQGASTTCTSMSVATSGTCTTSAWTPVFGSIQQPVGGTIHKFIQGWYATVLTNGTCTVTLTSNAASIGNSSIGGVEFSGFLNPPILDATQSLASGASTTMLAGSFSNALGNEAIVAFTNVNSGVPETASVNAPFAIGTSNLTGGGFVIAYATPTSGSSSFGGTWGTLGGNTMITAGFSLGFTLYSITGNAGRAGATVSYSGTASGSVVADGSGNYTIPNLSNGSYTITPSLVGFTFSPTSSVQSVSNANVTGVNFTASSSGSTGYSVPDCRVAPFGPNASRALNGTLIYDVQTSSNPAVPGVDSRTQGAPIDSRVAPNIPTNSRTPGTYGPGVN